MTRQVQQPIIVCIFCDFLTIHNNLIECYNSGGQALKMQIHKKTQELVQQESYILTK